MQFIYYADLLNASYSRSARTHFILQDTVFYQCGLLEAGRPFFVSTLKEVSYYAFVCKKNFDARAVYHYP